MSFRPLKEDHPAVGKPCTVCGVNLAVGDIPALIPGMPADDEEREKAAAGRPYMVLAGLAHKACKDGQNQEG